MSIRATILSLLLLLGVAGCSTGSMSSEDELMAPAPTEPAEGEQTADAVLLAWSPVEAAVEYRVQVATDSGFVEMVTEELVKPFPRVPVRELDMDESYFWRVRAESGGQASVWSEPRSFQVARIAHKPDPPRLVLPAYDQHDMDRLVRVAWEPVEDAYSYHLVVTLDEDMLLYQADLENLDTPYFDLEQLVFTYPYWWKVRSLGPAGYSEWSPVWLFWVRPGQ